jgi:hypothetical protein
MLTMSGTYFSIICKIDHYEGSKECIDEEDYALKASLGSNHMLYMENNITENITNEFLSKSYAYDDYCGFGLVDVNQNGDKFYFITARHCISYSDVDYK